jgi:hypothetical protein
MEYRNRYTGASGAMEFRRFVDNRFLRFPAFTGFICVYRRASAVPCFVFLLDQIEAPMKNSKFTTERPFRFHAFPLSRRSAFPCFFES